MFTNCYKGGVRGYKTIKRLNITVIPLVVGMLLLFFDSTSCSSQGKRPSALVNSARPQMPASFDRETVARLLVDIDKPYNASALKVGYFLRRGQPPLPVDEGFELLQAAALAEPVGTGKWFRLQNLRAFAAFRVPSADIAQGFEAYGAIFDHAADAATSGATYSLRQSIGEFVDSVPGKFNDFGLRKDERTKALLLRAWTAYAVALSQPMKGAVIDEPDWNRALVKSESLEAFVPAVEKVVADPKTPKSFGLLVAAAAVLAPTQPDKAIALWAQAKPLIPQTEGKADINQAARLYFPLVDLLAARDDLPGAIVNQREFVALSGRGQARLLLLLRKSGDDVAASRALAELSAPGANEREILEAATGLFKLARDAKTPDVKAGEQAEALLVGYLAATRTRDVASELKARLALGNFYLRAQRFDDAAKVTTFEAPAAAATSREVELLLRDVEQIKARLPQDGGTAKLEK